MRTHYPRTPHLPWSPGATRDDVRVADLAGFTGREVVVTEKLDGENTTLYADGLHARSLDSAHHPSRAWVKALHGRIGPHIPEGWRVCGENLYARHSLPYEDLDGYFYGFSVWDELHWCPGWDFTVDFLRKLGIPTPRVLWRGVFDERALRRLTVDTARQEGYVVRTADGFMAGDFGRHVAKWVRPGHVQTGTHWMHTAVTPNRLGPRAALWDVRSGGAPDAGALLAAVGLEDGDAAAAAEVGAAAGARLGDARLAGVLAGLLHREPRGTLAGRLAPALGLPLARRVADLVGLHAGLHRPYPDEERRAGLVRMAYAVDLDVLHAVAWAAAPDAAAREQVDWSALLAEDARLLGSGPRRSGGSSPTWRPKPPHAAGARPASRTRTGASRPRRKPSPRPGGGGTGRFRGWSTWWGRPGAGRARSPGSCPASARTCPSTNCGRSAAAGPTSAATPTCCGRGWPGSTPRWPPGTAPLCGTPRR